MSAIATTTVTNIMRGWKSVFQNTSCKKVFFNWNQIWMILWKELSEALESSWVLTQVREELWEANDEETLNLIKQYKNWNLHNSTTLDNFREEYGI